MTKDDVFSGPCDDDCPVRRAARVIEGKWTTLIVRDLLSGPKRFSELQRSLVGISPKMLSQRLDYLAEEGMVRRKAYPVVPPHTEYSLTPLGAGLEPVIAAMAAFGNRLAAGEIT